MSGMGFLKTGDCDRRLLRPWWRLDGSNRLGSLAGMICEIFCQYSLGEEQGMPRMKIQNHSVAFRPNVALAAMRGRARRPSWSTKFDVYAERDARKERALDYTDRMLR